MRDIRGGAQISIIDLRWLVLVLIFLMTERMTKCSANWPFLLRPIRLQKSVRLSGLPVKGRIIYTRRKVAGKRSLSGGLDKFLRNKGLC